MGCEAVDCQDLDQAIGVGRPERLRPDRAAVSRSRGTALPSAARSRSLALCRFGSMHVRTVSVAART